MAVLCDKGWQSLVIQAIVEDAATCCTIYEKLWRQLYTRDVRHTSWLHWKFCGCVFGCVLVRFIPGFWQ
jgi:hypothetical protein